MPERGPLGRRSVRTLPLYNAGLSSTWVQGHYGLSDVAGLASNENPEPPSPGVQAALADWIGHANRYPDGASRALREALALRSGFEAGCIVCGNGSEDIIKLLCEALLDPGDRVVTLQPSFGLHEIYPMMMGARVDKVACDRGFGFDSQAWRDALATPARMLLLSVPSNPLGSVPSAATLRAILDAAGDDTVLVLDEAYHEFGAGLADYPDLVALLRAQHRPWIVLRTFSKAYALAGLRVGYGLAGDPELIELLERVRTPFNVNAAAQVAARAALQEPEIMQRSVARLCEERDRTAALLASRGFEVAPSRANFLFLRVRNEAVGVARALLPQGIIVKPWTEPGWQDCLRVSIGTRPHNDRFVEAITMLGR